MPLRKLTVVLCLLAAAGASMRAGAQDFSGLLRKELRPATLAGATLDGLIAGLIVRDRESPNARIDRVVVTDDSERRLVIRVEHTNVAGKQISGEVLNTARARMPVTGRPMVLPAGPAELSFELDASVREGASLQAAFLRLTVGDPGAEPIVRKTYALPKKWQSTVRPENLVITVKPRAVGAAAQLGPVPPGEAPPPIRVLSPTVSRSDAIAVRQPIMATRTRVASPRTMEMDRSGGVVLTNAAIAKKTEVAVKELPASSKMILATNFRYGLNQQDVDRGARGPSANTLDLLEGLRADNEVPVDRDSVIHLFPQVYRDQNDRSGIFYFLPRAYRLDWDPDNGHAMRILYGAAATEGQPGEVLFATRMECGADSAEIQLARTLLNAYRQRNPSTVFNELRPLPIAKPPEVSLAGGLGRQYNIPADKIAVNALSDALGGLEVSWVTDTVTKENLQLALTEDVGVNGTLTFTPVGEGLAPVAIPIAIRLAEAESFGRLRWTRNDPWRNRTGFPIRLRYLHALLVERNTPYVYSWKIDQPGTEYVEAPPLAQVRFDGSAVPAWLEQRAGGMWIEYEPVKTCEACKEEALKRINGSVSSLSSSQVTFRTITPLADTGAFEIDVRMRSKYFDARSGDMQEKSLVLNKDNQDFKVGPVYLVDRQAGEARPGDPLFEYTLDVIMPDGATRQGSNWLAVDGLRVLIGKVQVEQAVGPLPPRANP